jgi:hypothetical protein
MARAAAFSVERAVTAYEDLLFDEGPRRSAAPSDPLGRSGGRRRL